MMKLNWGFNSRVKPFPRTSAKDTLLNDNFIRLDDCAERLRWPEKRPSRDALRLCNSIKTGNIPEYLDHLEQLPRRKMLRVFLGIIYSKSAGLPVLYDEEMPPVNIRGTSFDAVPNVQSRMMTKITLLITVKNESQKLGIWEQVRPQWMEKYTHETKMYVRILEAIKNQCENTPQSEKVAELLESIERIKAANLEYNIKW
jgi:hypothetical protein